MLVALTFLVAAIAVGGALSPQCKELLDFHERQFREGKLCNTAFNSSIGFNPKTAELQGAELVHKVGHDLYGQPTFMSGGAQDWWVYMNHARFMKSPGFFVDLATNHPIIRSNTWFLEQCLGWKGLCIEPTPSLHASIRRERSCTLVPNCISGDGSALNFWVSDGNTAGSSRIVKPGGKPPPGAGHFENIKCKKLSDVLSEHNVKHVDYFSLDVEGHEAVALSTLDFTKVTVDILISESPKVTKMLTTNGFKDYGSKFNLQFDQTFMRKGFKLGIQSMGGKPIPNPTIEKIKVPGFPKPRPKKLGVSCAPLDESQRRAMLAAPSPPSSITSRIFGRRQLTSRSAETLSAAVARGSASSMLSVWRSVLSAADLSMFQAATGASAERLLDELHRLPPSEIKRISGLERVVGHPLNSKGLHVLRALLAERLTDRTRESILRRSTVDSELASLRERYLVDGFIKVPLAKRPMKTDDATFVLKLLRMVSGLSMKDLLVSRPEVRAKLLSTESDVRVSFGDLFPSRNKKGIWDLLQGKAVDIQHYMHVDTFHPTWKAWIFNKGTNGSHGALHYVRGSHRLNEGKLRWLHERTSTKLTNASVATTKLQHTREGPFMDPQGALVQSIRFAGFDPQRPHERNLGALNSFGFGPIEPMTADADHPATLVIADTVGLHFRGRAPGAKRLQCTLDLAGKTNPENNVVPRRSLADLARALS